jgi:23S rRNA pseudouridine1911/1915/1917 synthase
MTNPIEKNLPTLAKYIRAQKPDLSWSDCRAMIRSGKVTVNENVVTDDTIRVNPHDEVIIHSKPQKIQVTKSGGEPSIRSQNLHVYFYDEHLIVAEKPTGVESVPFDQRAKKKIGSHDVNLTFIEICHHWLEVRENRKLPPLRIVQRLDKGTSGIMVFARTPLAERQLGQLFRTHDIQRMYTAFCVGKPSSQTVRSNLVENRGDGRRGSTKNLKLGRDSTTHIRYIESRNARGKQIVSKVECKLETGRTHQIRIHMSESGHPLCGEEVYKNPKAFAEEIPDHSQIPRIGLHATTLGFLHPIIMKEMFWESSLPTDLAQWWDRCSEKT